MSGQAVLRDNDGDRLVSEIPGSDTAGPASGLSVVVVTYNEADRIEACLDAVFESCRSFDGVEVVLVDSRSTDGTIDLAADYPIRIYRLPASVERTPGGGRFVGTQATSGDRVLHVDGDMVVSPAWLTAAVERLATDSRVAGVDGHLNESDASSESPVEALRGVVLYDRAALSAVGGFDPYLHALEDIELGFRLTDAGYRLVRLPSVAATHPFGDGVAELRRRWESGYYFGRGQLLRKWVRSPRILARTARYSRLYAAMGAWLLTGTLGTLAVGPVGGLAWLCVTFVLVGLCLRVRGRTWVKRKVISVVPVYVGALVGFLGRHPPASAYPVEDAELIQTRPRRSRPDPGGVR